jgi:hypothetical protein
VQKLDLKPLLNGRNIAENPQIGPGDMLIIPESNLTKFKKVVPYSFGATYLTPGSY